MEVLSDETVIRIGWGGYAERVYIQTGLRPVLRITGLTRPSIWVTNCHYRGAD